jgi:hypothetical protein
MPPDTALPSFPLSPALLEPLDVHATSYFAAPVKTVSLSIISMVTPGFSLAIAK